MQHVPVASTLPVAQRALVPVLKEAGWAHQPHCLTLPFPGLARPDAPVLAFAEDTPGGYVFLSREEAQGCDLGALYAAALGRLAARPTDIALVSPAIAASAGRDLSAERILDGRFLQALHHTLRSDDLWVCVPHRVGLYAVRADAPAAEIAQFVTLVGFEARRGPELGHAPVSPLAFRVVSGQVRDAAPLHALSALGSAALAAVPQAALLALCLAGVLRGALGLVRILPMLLGGVYEVIQTAGLVSLAALAAGMLGARALGPLALAAGGAAVGSLGLSLLARVVSMSALFTLSGLLASAALAGAAFVLRQALRTDAATVALIVVLAGVVGARLVPFPGVSLAVAAGFTYLAFAALSARR